MDKKRRFTFDEREFKIVEVISNPKISMDWNWGGMMCPHCKEKIDNIKTHIFNEIEILIPVPLLEKKVDKKTLLSEIKMLGTDKNNKKLLLNKETEEKVLKLSNFFKEVI